MKTIPIITLIATFAGLSLTSTAQSQETTKTFIDYFKPTPIVGTLSKDIWGAPEVGPRDPKNGLEDVTRKTWDYWDGQIIQGKDGKFHLFASRWDQSKGHNGWRDSKAVSAVSSNPFGPYIDQGPCWPDDEGGKGHNVTALTLHDGRYAVVISETRPGQVFVSNSLDGPWKNLGRLQVANNEFSKLGRTSNVSIMARPNGGYQIVARSGAIWISEKDILGPYTVQGPSVYENLAGLPQQDLRNFEDPVIWCSGGLYHIVVNNWSQKKAYHLTSVDGINDWKFRGLAYDPTKDFVRYTDGTVNHWNKLERPSVILKDGHVVAMTLAVLDVRKEDEKGNDNHGNKVIVIPFDGAALDADLKGADGR
ncbi:MAG: glycoside hydrolase family protein [Luteolibacter sp.]